MKILLTGAAGFIGFHLASELLKKKHSTQLREGPEPIVREGLEDAQQRGGALLASRNCALFD